MNIADNLYNNNPFQYFMYKYYKLECKILINTMCNQVFAKYNFLGNSLLFNRLIYSATF